jgi:hypothetical protein
VGDERGIVVKKRLLSKNVNVLVSTLVHARDRNEKENEHEKLQV